jgi:tetratricopeptide (TPR) repeat protein
VDQALAAYDSALHFRPDLAVAHFCRGDALHAKGHFNEALAAYKKAIEFNPKWAEAHFNRGRVLREIGELVDAQAAFEKAIVVKRDYAEAHCQLGAVLMMQGRFTEALAAYRQGHELGSKNPRWSYPSAQWVRTVEQLIGAEKKLPELRRGVYTPADAGERLRFARCCAYKGLHGAAARQFEETFKARPELAENVSAGHRSRAACSAALAGCGQGEDAGELDDLARAYWRDCALTWLRNDLRAWTKRFEGDKRQPAADVRRVLRLWQQDKQLACVRDAAEIARLPAAEQESFKQLWADVADLLQRADSRK